MRCKRIIAFLGLFGKQGRGGGDSRPKAELLEEVKLRQAVSESPRHIRVLESTPVPTMKIKWHHDYLGKSLGLLDGYELFSLHGKYSGARFCYRFFLHHRLNYKRNIHLVANRHYIALKMHILKY